MQGEKIIIIGSGIAGLAAAARLAAKGWQVNVYEKNAVPGGKLGLLNLKGYTFDTGPSLFTQPYLLEDLFITCGKNPADYLQYDKLEINTQYFFEDGTRITAYNNQTLLAQEIEKKLLINPDNLLQYLKELKILYQSIGSIFLDMPLYNADTWFNKRLISALKALKGAYLFKSMHSYHVSRLQHPKLVQLFDRFATYNGSNPYQAPAMLSMIGHLEMNEGAYYPKGGMISIVDALYQLCKDLGVAFHFNTRVETIVVSNKKIAGIKTGNRFIPADKIISNSDIYFTYKNLLGNDAVAGRLKKQERSSSAVIFYWGVKKKFPELGLHNILFSKNYEGEFDALFNKKTFFDDPTIYINITAKKDTAHAPDGCENWFVLINTPAGLNVAYNIAAIRKATIQKLNRMLGTDMESIIETEHVLTPSIIEKQTESYLGALYGTASNNRLAAFARHGNISKEYTGLYFAGGTVHPGGGIPLCLRSAKLVSEAIS